MKRLWSRIKEQPDKWIFRILLAAFLASMIPLWYLSRYTVPGCDDYTYGVKTHGAWLATHSLLEVLRAALETTKEYWHLWQGTYSSIFLMTLSPGILDEKWYFLTTFLMTGMLIASVTALVWVVLKKYVCEAPQEGRADGKAADVWKKEGKYQAGICILVLLFLIFQTMVAPSDGLFWYNGALHYVFMESVLFFQAAVLLSWRKAKSSASQAAWLVLAMLLSFVLGGANLLTGLQSCILMTFLMLYNLYRLWRGNKKRIPIEKRQLWLLFPYFLNLSGFALNVLAPGNTVRETTAQGMSAAAAIVMSFYWGAVFVTEWLTPIVLAGFLLLCPAIWRLVKKSEAQFLNPAVTVFFSYCVFAAMFTPTLYATSSEGPDRCKNVMRIVLYLLVFFNLANAFGWFFKHRKDALICRMLRVIEENYAGWLFFCMAAVGCIFLLAADKNTYTSISALRSVANGEAAQYYEENRARLALYNDENVPDVEITCLTAKPYLLFKADVGNEGSTDYWINISIVDYYQKNSLTVVEDEP